MLLLGVLVWFLYFLCLDRGALHNSISYGTNVMYEVVLELNELTLGK